MNTIVISTEKDMQIWTMMKLLESLGVFDTKLGKVTIDFDGQGRIGNIKIEKNYRVPHVVEILTVAPK